MNRAYSLLIVKSIDADRRLIRGTATTPAPDRTGDIIEPLGASFPPELPLLLHHRKESPVGVARFQKPTRGGIDFEAELPIIQEPGAVKDEVDRAWHSIQHRLIRGISIGFRVVDDGIELMKTGGMRFLKTEILELSLVTVPANQDATLSIVKSLDAPYLAASGPYSPGVTGTLPVVRAVKGAAAMTIQEQITQFENTRAAKAARMTEIQGKASAEGRTKDQAEKEESDTLKLEIKAIDDEMVDLRDMEKMNLTKATPITASTPAEASVQRGGGTTSVVSVKSMLPKGTAFTRYVMAKVFGKGDSYKELEYAKQWKDSTPEVELMLKAASAAGTTLDATWAGPLAVTQTANEFLELLRPETIIGKIPNLRRVPFNVSVPSQTAGGTYQWTGQGSPKPVGTLQFSAVTLGIAKAAGIIVITEELVRVGTPSAEATVRADMIAGMRKYLDEQFIDPAIAAVTNVSPASITNGTSALTTAGTSADNAKTDLKALVATFVAANLSVSGAVLIMSEANAFALATAVNPLGQALFPGMTAKGGNALGIQVITSQSAGNNVVLVDPQGILYADEGGVNIDVSREASVQMDSAPTDPPVAATVMVSLWQNNLVGLRAEHFINWKRARTASVKYVVASYV